MATRFYLHAAIDSTTSGLPSTEQSSLTSAVDATAQSNNRVMNTSVGTSVVGIGTTSTSSSNRNCYFGRWLSPPLYQSSIAANTWTWNFGAEQNQTVANFPVSGSDQPVHVNCYVWRPSNGTKVGTILDGNTASTVDAGGNNARLAHHVAFSGSAVSSMQDGDVVMFEAWFIVSSGATGRTMNMVLDGTTVNTTDNATVTSHASFIETPEDLVLVPPLTLVSQTSVQKYHVNHNVAQTNIEKYHVAHNVNQSTIQKYHVAHNVNQSTIQKYNVRSNTSQVSIQRYHINDVASDTLLHTSLNQSTTANTTQYWQITGARSISTTKSDVQIVIRAPGTIHSLLVKLNGNSIPTGGITFTLHVNDSDTALTVIIPPSGIGIFEDVDPTHAVTVSPGDKVCIKSVPLAATGTVNVNHQGALFKADTNRASAIQIVATGLGGAFNADDSTRYWGLGGQILNSQVTEAFTPIRIKKAGTLRNLVINVTANTRTTNTVYTVRKNGTTDTSLAVTVAAGQTGFIENNTNIAEIADDDTLTLKSVTGSGGGSITVPNTSVEYDNALGYGFGLDLMTGGQAHEFNLTGYFTVHGQTVQRYTTEDQAIMTARDFMEYSNLTAFVTINTLDEDVIIKFMHNLVDGSQVLTIPAGQTGFFTETTNTDLVSPGDIVTLQLDTTAATTGLIKFGSISVWTDGSWLSLNVSQQNIHKYHVRQNISQQSIQKYNVLQNIAQSLIAKYHVFHNVALSSIQKYHILQNVAQSSIQKWNISQYIASSSIQKYNILNWISQVSIQKYDVRNWVNQVSIQKYHILNNVAESLIAKYHVFQNIAETSIHKYHVLAMAAAESIQKYDIAQLIAEASIHKYDIREFVSALSIHKYDVSDITLVAQSLIAKYHVLQNVAEESIHKYNIAHLISSTSIQKYDVLHWVSQTSNHVYDVLQNVALESIHKYNVLHNVALESIQKYNVAGMVSALSVHGYDVLQYTSTVSTHLWNVLENVAASNVHKFNVLQLIAQTSIHKFDVAQAVGLVASLSIQKYHVLQNIASENIQKYHILNTVAEESIQKYHVFHNVALETIHKWHVRQNISEISTHVYDMAGIVSSESIQKYHVLTNVFAESIQKYHVYQYVSLISRHTFDILQNVSAESRHTYDILADILLVSQTSIHKYHVRENISSISRHIYDVAGRKGLKSLFHPGSAIETKGVRKILKDILKGEWPN